MIDERLGFGANCLAHDPIPPGNTKITATAITAECGVPHSGTVEQTRDLCSFA